MCARIAAELVGWRTDLLGFASTPLGPALAGRQPGLHPVVAHQQVRRARQLVPRVLTTERAHFRYGTRAEARGHVPSTVSEARRCSKKNDA